MNESTNTFNTVHAALLKSFTEPFVYKIKDLAKEHNLQDYDHSHLPQTVICTTPLDDAIVVAVIHSLYSAEPGNNGPLANTNRAWYSMFSVS